MALMCDYKTSKFHHQAPFVSKVVCICTLCAWVFFSTVLPGEFIYVKLHNFESGEIYSSNVNIHKGY